jgi:catechol 2,3-dioxygenase-like lactoylglutathione lyase family enzyme
MKIRRIDHVGIVVHDLSAAKAFFLDLGLELQGEVSLEGEWLDRVVGLDNVRTTIVMLHIPGSQVHLELSTFQTPSDESGGHIPRANTPGIRHIAFAVEDIEAVVAGLKKKGTEFFSGIQYYKEMYKLCYLRGPEGIILELAEEIK